MSEDFYVDGETVYVCFESAAKYYNKDWLSLFTEKSHVSITTTETIIK